MNNWRLLFAGIGLILLLNGCADSAPIPVPAAPSAPVPQEDIQNNSEREMVLLFQSLVQLDRRDNLTITGKQAEEMLPMVLRNSEVGRLTQADQKQLLHVLTPEQREFVNDFQERAKNRKQAMKEFKEKERLSDEEREKMIHEFEARRSQEHEADHQVGVTGGRKQDNGGPGLGPGGKNVEQQLIDLLQAKAGKTNDGFGGGAKAEN